MKRTHNTYETIAIIAIVIDMNVYYDNYLILVINNNINEKLVNKTFTTKTLNKIKFLKSVHSEV